MTTSSNRDVHQYLRAKGFRLCAPAPEAKVSYEGQVRFHGNPVRIRLDIPDWDFRSRPQVRLLERPEALRGFRPHLGSAANLCYVDREAVYMDSYDPVGVVAGCLAKAESTLEEISGRKERIDVYGEFLVNWSADVVFPLMLWTAAAESKRPLAVINVDFPHRPGLCVITDSIEQTTRFLRSIDGKVGNSFEGSVVEFHTDRAPLIDPDNWPPKRLRDVFRWLDGWDHDLRRHLHGRLEGLWSKDRDTLVALFSTPTGRFGLEFHIDYKNASEMRRLGKHAGDRRHRIIALNPKIKRFVVSDMSPSFLHGRNQSDRETLAGKRIAVVGCGTVGGYLATFLARLGAGYGGGALKLYETQPLMPENLGRHVLSSHHLFRNKAEGVVDNVLKEFPYLEIRARKVDATDSADLFESDLIVDASGSSAISGVINRQHMARLKKGDAASAVLYSWIEGPGDAARCLLVDSLKFMCHECMYVRRDGQVPKVRFPVSTRDVASGREYPGGCGGYMPFAVSAAAIAAALALDAARAWARGEPHPRLRSRQLDFAHTQKCKDSSPEPLKSCPACRDK